MKILLVGASGAMGKVICQIIEDHEDIEIAAGISGKDYQEDFPVYSEFENIEEDFDCIIDFSNSSLTSSLLDFIEISGKRAVIATTDLSEDLKDRMKEISKTIPIFYSQNTSIGVNLINNIVGYLARVLTDFDIEIIEKHHNTKVDAPSGSAEMFFDSIKEYRKDAYEVYDRTKEHKKRDKNEVGISSIRGGTIVGEHSVIFAGIDEVVEIKHIPGSKRIFANGAIKAAKFLMTKNSGFYNMEDVLNE